MSQASRLSTGGSGPVPPTILKTLTGNVGVATTSANNINTPGNNTANNGFGTWTIGTGANMSINSYGTAKWVVNHIAGVGTHQNLQSAHDSASAGDTIFVTSGNYVGNLNITKNLTFFAYGSLYRDGSSLNTTIIGKITVATSAAVNFRNFVFNNNAGDWIFDISGASCNIVTQDCYYLVNSHDGINVNSTSSNFYIKNCAGALSNTFTLGQVPAGLLWIDDSEFRDIGTPAIMNCGAQSIRISNSEIHFPISSSGTGILLLENVIFGSILPPFNNFTFITANSATFSYCYDCIIYSGTESSISVGTGATIIVMNTIINSSNVSAIKGLGTLKYDNINFVGTSSTISVTTQNPLIQSNDSIQVIRPTAYPFTVSAQDALISVDTSTTPNTVNLPANPSQGEKHIVKDRSANAATNNITVSGNGHNIVGTTLMATQVISLNGASVTYIFDTTFWLST